MTIRLYVGNLAYSMKDQELNELFAKFGEVQSASIITDRETGRSRGFGFVEMATQEQGEAAIKELHGKTINDRTIVVNEAHAKPARGRNNNRSGGGRRRYSDS